MAAATGLELARTARLFHALSDPTRLRLLAMLRRRERCVCELMDATEAAQSRVSFHLKVLKEAGLIVDRREGRWVHYSVNPAAVAALRRSLSGLIPTREPAARSAC